MLLGTTLAASLMTPLVADACSSVKTLAKMGYMWIARGWSTRLYCAALG
jgi:hypothetical protein